MRNIITIINLAILFGITSILSRSDRFESNKANTDKPGESKEVAASEGADMGIIQSNFTVWPIQWTGDEGAEKNEDADEELVAFVREMIDAKMWEREQGKIASQRATKRQLKDYGAMMVKDQSAMLADLKGLSAKNSIAFPENVTDDMVKGLNAWKNVHGESFDKKFITMMIKDHKKSIKKLEKATRSEDADVQVFATKYLPVVQSHLDIIRALKKANRK